MIRFTESSSLLKGEVGAGTCRGGGGDLAAARGCGERAAGGPAGRAGAGAGSGASSSSLLAELLEEDGESAFP